MGRMNELAIMANDGTKSFTDRQNLQKEFEQLQKEIQRITSGATAAGRFNNVFLFRGGTGVGTIKADRIVGAPITSASSNVILSHDGSNITTASWSSTYTVTDPIAGTGYWTIRNKTTGVDVATLNANWDVGGTVDLQTTHGFRFSFEPPQYGTFNTGDNFTWENVGYVAPTVSASTFTSAAVTGTMATATAQGDGSNISTALWAFTYHADTRLWTTRNATTGTVIGTTAATPESGMTIDLEGAHGFRFVIPAPTAGSYGTGDQFTVQNMACTLGGVGYTPSTLTGAGAVSVQQGDGSGVTTASWSATYDAALGAWNIRRSGVLVTQAIMPPDGGGTVGLEGVNGSNVLINPPTTGSYSMGDQFTWSNIAGLPPTLGSVTFTNQGVSGAGAALSLPGTGVDVTTANWDAIYDAGMGRWDIRREGIHDSYYSRQPQQGGNAILEGANGFRFSIATPSSGSYGSGDRFAWSNNGTSIAGSPAFARAAHAGTATLAYQGDGYDVTRTAWSATYNANDQQWTLRNLTTGLVGGMIASTPGSGGAITNREGVDGFRLTIAAPASGSYATGDRFTWNNIRHVAAVVGPPYFQDLETTSLALQVGPDSHQIFTEPPIRLEASTFEVIGSYMDFSYGSINMTLLGSTHGVVRWGSLIGTHHVRIEEQPAAQAAVRKMAVGIDHISSIRAIVGAEMNRMQVTLSGLRDYSENIHAAESRIRDTDIALETTSQSKYMILQQIGSAMLAQANALPQGVLQLLG